MSEVIVLYDGYSSMCGKDQMSANCSCSLIIGENNIIVDTMTAWDSEKVLTALKKHNITPDNIDYVVSTHGHSDHLGNNNLFKVAKHIVGFSISFQDKYYIHPFNEGKEYDINHSVKVIPTPGHTLSDVTVVVKTSQNETIAITGDLFEKLEDVQKQDIWLEAGSEDPKQQIRNRSKIANIADWIVPGHGPMFQVTKEIREILDRQSTGNSQ